jgi:steroid delta-isomerase-like uncharacterized protein
MYTAIENNKAIIRNWIDAWLKKDFMALDKIFAPGYTVNGMLVGPEGVKQAVELFHSALADLSLELDEIVAEDTKVVARWTLRGRHVGEFIGVAPTGKLLELKGINIYNIIDGRIAANHEQTNVPEVLQRLTTNS